MFYKLPYTLIDTLRNWLPVFYSTTLVTFSIGLYYAIYNSPPDYIQGDSMRIMYVHVPAAWLSLGSYSILAISCIAWFVFRNPIFNLFAKSIFNLRKVVCKIAFLTNF